jgi:inhibitor of KinA sporulation pathway (predicted exonuclease)
MIRVERKMAEPIKHRSREWKNGFQRGAAQAKERIWEAVIRYVEQHDPEKADALRADIITAMTAKSANEREAEAPPRTQNHE